MRSRVGYPIAKDDVLGRPGVADRWHALAAVDTIDYQLESRRVWLLGEHTGRWAMWLTFAVPGQSFDTSVQPGQVIDADLHFYPGGGEHRALVGVARPVTPSPPACSSPTVLQSNGHSRRRAPSLAEIRAQFAAQLAADPWASRIPALVRAVPVPPDDPGESWRLLDEAGESCPLEQCDVRSVDPAGALLRRPDQDLRRVARQCSAAAGRVGHARSAIPA